MDGSYEYSEIVEINLEEPLMFELQQNYPNPFNPTTTIKYSISTQQVSLRAPMQSERGNLSNISQSLTKPTDCFGRSSLAMTKTFSRNDAVNVNLTVYDVLGRKVATLVNERQAPGNYSVRFNAENLASGIYFYKLSAGEINITKKMILMK